MKIVLKETDEEKKGKCVQEMSLKSMEMSLFSRILLMMALHNMS